MIPTNRDPTHPGETLRLDFRLQYGYTQRHLDEVLGVAPGTVRRLEAQRIDVDDSLARLLSKTFVSTSPEFWRNLQRNYDDRKSRSA